MIYNIFNNPIKFLITKYKKIKKNIVFIIKIWYIYIAYFYGEIAQLARASGSYPEGRGFDPLSRYQLRLLLDKNI